MLQTLCTTKRVLSNSERENRFRTSMDTTLIQSMLRDVLRTQLNLKCSKKETKALVETDKKQFAIPYLVVKVQVSSGNWGRPPTVLYTGKASYGNTSAKKENSDRDSE